jgi:hypothetical protein
MDKLKKKDCDSGTDKILFHTSTAEVPFDTTGKSNAIKDSQFWLEKKNQHL